MHEAEIPKADGADWRVYAIEEPQYKLIVQRMRAELAHVPVEAITHVSHAVSRTSLAAPPQYSVMVIYRDRL